MSGLGGNTHVTGAGIVVDLQARMLDWDAVSVASSCSSL